MTSSTDVVKNVSKEKHITEEMELSQSKLVMGFRTQISAGDEEAVAERLMCAVLGGTASSKLFNMEALRNVNRTHYGLSATPSEAEIEFDKKSKTDFALKLIYDNPNYTIPQYIKNGLMWLNDQKVLM